MQTLNPMPELTPVLKQLRLSGLLDTLAQRNREAIEGKLSYPEFLALLITDEAARRDQKKYSLRLRRAGFRGDKTLENFDFAFNTVGVHRLEARAAAANARCQAAMQKLGAVREGVLRKSLTTLDGTRLDQVLWSLLDEDWRELNAADVIRVH